MINAITDTVEIYDPVSEKHRKVRNLQVKTFDEGEGVSFLVVSNRRKDWPMWLPIRDFKKHNVELYKQLMLNGNSE